MLKCPFCGFANEDGALFCEQCKSDLSAVAPAPAPVPAAHGGHAASPPAHVPVAEVIEAVEIFEPNSAPFADLTPVAAHHNADIPAAEFVDVPSAEIVEPLAEEPPPVPDPMPAPLPSLAPPVEEEAMAWHAAEAAHAAHATPAHAPQSPPSSPAAATPASATPAAPAPAGKATSVPTGAQPKLVVKRGQKIGFEFPIYSGDNYVGRSDEKPVDIDLEDQEPPERVWCSRQHALIHFDENLGNITLEDLNSSNGTYVNRERVYPGQPRQLFVNDTIQIGTVHLTLKV